jgi:hypothetical protein
MMLVVVALVLPASPARALQAPDTIVTTIAYQPFEHGYMLWREDLDKITVVYADIPTKSGGACSEVYRDTFEGQPYEIPPPPPGQLTVPTLGFGWLYRNDPLMARRLGYAVQDEVSQTAEITTVTADGGRQIVVVPAEPLPGSTQQLVTGDPEEPGLTYCFPRRNENRDVVNTWTARQLFEHGAMVWRQDMPDRVEVWHFDTQLAPEIACGDTLADAWKPGMELSYGDLAVPGQRLPVRGFGQVWLDREYIRNSLGYPIGDEQGGFAELSYEPFQHPTRGRLLIRHMTVHLPDGQNWVSKVTIPNATSPSSDRIVSTACQRILTPHQGTHYR